VTTLSDMLEKVRRAVVRRGAPFDDAEDIVQEAFARLEAYTQAHEVRSQEAFLMRAAINISRDDARRRRAAPFASDAVQLDAIPDGAPQPDEILRAQERIRRASAGLDQLSPMARRALIAQRLEGLTYAEIAKCEGVPISTVEKQVARAVLFLVRWMDDW
jgi:RNA polymerase sigma factor (sigma-70 family)